MSRHVASALLLIGALGGCNDTRDLASPDPATPWNPVVRIDDGGFAPATGQAAAGARSTGAATMPQAGRRFSIPADPGLPYPDPHPSIDPAHAYALVELVDIAERNNRQTRIAWEAARQAAIEVGISRAAYLPALTLSALAGFRHETTPAQVPQGYVASDTEALFPTLAIQYLLTDFGGRDAATRSAKNLSEASNVEFNLAHQQLILTVTRDYLALAAAEADLEASEKALRNADLLRNSANDRLARGEGLVTESDDAGSGVAQARYAIVAATAARNTDRDTLLEAMGLPPRTGLRVEGLATEPVPQHMAGDLDVLMHSALSSRPDLLAALARLRASEADTAHARAALYPSISLNIKTGGDIGHISVENYAAHSFDQPEAGIYLDFNWSIYQGGSLASQVRLAQSREAEQAATLQKAEDDAMRDVAAAYDELDSGIAEYAAAVAQQKAADKAFVSNAAAFRQGTGTITDAESAQTTLDRADATLVRAHAQVLASSASLAFATGQLTTATRLGK